LKLEGSSETKMVEGMFDLTDFKLDNYHLNKKSSANQLTRLIIDANFSISKGARPTFKLRKGAIGYSKLRVYDPKSQRDVAVVEDRLQNSDINEVEVPLKLTDMDEPLKVKTDTLQSRLRFYRTNWPHIRERINARSLREGDSDTGVVKWVGDQMRLELANFEESDFRQGAYNKLQELTTDIQRLGDEIRKTSAIGGFTLATHSDVQGMITLGDELQKRVEQILPLVD
jgi:hypothetical protein